MHLKSKIATVENSQARHEQMENGWKDFMYSFTFSVN